MNNTDLQKFLDSLDKGPLGKRTEGQWDVSFWMKGEDNIAKSEQARNKMSKAAKNRHKNGWASPIRYEWTVENNPNKGGNKGKDNPVYGSGAKYKELTTGFIGTCYDMKQKYPGWMPQICNRKKIRKDSLYPNLKWAKLDKNDKRTKTTN